MIVFPVVPEVKEVVPEKVQVIAAILVKLPVMIKLKPAPAKVGVIAPVKFKS